MWLPSLSCIRTGTNCQLGESQSQDFQVQNVTAEPIMHTNRNKLPTWGIPIPGFFTWKIPIKPNVAALYIVLNHQDFSGISEVILENSALSKFYPPNDPGQLYPGPDTTQLRTQVNLFFKNIAGKVKVYGKIRRARNLWLWIKTEGQIS